MRGKLADTLLPVVALMLVCVIGIIGANKETDESYFDPKISSCAIAIQELRGICKVLAETHPSMSNVCFELGERITKCVM